MAIFDKKVLLKLNIPTLFMCKYKGLLSHATQPPTDLGNYFTSPIRVVSTADIKWVTTSTELTSPSPTSQQEHMVRQIKFSINTSNHTHPTSTLIPLGRKFKQLSIPLKFNPQTHSTCSIPSNIILLTQPQEQPSKCLVRTVLMVKLYIPPRVVLVWSRLPCMKGS